MGINAKGHVRLRNNVSIDTFLSLCEKTFNEFPDAKQWERLMYFSPDYLFQTEKITEVLMFRYIKQFNNLLVNFISRKLLKSFNLIFDNRLWDCYSYYENSPFDFDDDYFKNECGIIEMGDDLFHYEQCFSLGLGLIDALPTLKYSSLDGCCVWSKSEDLEEFLATIPSDEHTGKKIVNYYLPELMESDPDLFHQSNLVEYICEAAMYASDYQDFTIYENKCLCAYHKWVEETGYSISKKMIKVIDACEQILLSANVSYTATNFITTQAASYFIRLNGYCEHEGLCVDCKCIYPMAFFALVAIDVILQYLNSRYHFYEDAEEKEV